MVSPVKLFALKLKRYFIARRRIVQCTIVIPTMNPIEKSQRMSAVLQTYRRLYGTGGCRVLHAPARLNILGEHVDYVSYLPTASLPFGSHEHGMTMIFRPNETGQVRGASMNKAFAPFSFALQAEPNFAEQSWNDYLYSRPTPISHWSNYVKGAVLFVQHKHQLQHAQGFDFLIDSTIPPQGGSSSSSALVVLAGAAFRQINQIRISRKELAQDSALAEWYVGTRGGALDHTTICLAKKNLAIHLSYADNRAELVALPATGFRWLTFFSQAADKGKEIMLEYNERAAVARLLIPAIIDDWKIREPNIYAAWLDGRDYWQSGLRPIAHVQSVLNLHLPKNISLHEVEKLYPEAFQQCQLAFPQLVAECADKSLKIRDRALHHIGEISRVAEAVKILRSEIDDEAKMRTLGKLLDDSHNSLRDLYEVSPPMVNHLVDIIHADARVYGTRLIGGGFGGNVLTLTTTENVQSLIARVQREYYAPQQRDGMAEGAVMISMPGDGLKKLSVKQL